MADVVPGVETLTLTRQGDKYQVHNPTPYHFSFVELRSSLKGKGVENFEPVMVEPKGEMTLNVSAAQLGNSPVLMFVNDYGSQRLLPFSCSGSSCKPGKVEKVPGPTLNNSVAPLKTEQRAADDTNGQKDAATSESE